MICSRECFYVYGLKVKSVEELRAQVAKEQAPSDTGETIPPTQSDSQQGDDMVGQTASEEMYLCTVEEERWDESMLNWCRG